MPRSPPSSSDPASRTPTAPGRAQRPRTLPPPRPHVLSTEADADDEDDEGDDGSDEGDDHDLAPVASQVEDVHLLTPCPRVASLAPAPRRRGQQRGSKNRLTAPPAALTPRRAVPPRRRVPSAGDLHAGRRRLGHEEAAASLDAVVPVLLGAPGEVSPPPQLRHVTCGERDGMRRRPRAWPAGGSRPWPSPARGRRADKRQLASAPDTTRQLPSPLPHLLTCTALAGQPLGHVGIGTHAAEKRQAWNEGERLSGAGEAGGHGEGTLRLTSIGFSPGGEGGMPLPTCGHPARAHCSLHAAHAVVVVQPGGSGGAGANRKGLGDMRTAGRAPDSQVAPLEEPGHPKTVLVEGGGS